MKFLFLTAFTASLLFSNASKAQTSTQANKQLESLFNAYYEDGLKLSPVSATYYGDNSYNDQLPAEFTDSYHAKVKGIYIDYLEALSKFKREKLSENDRLSYDILKWQLKMNLDGLAQKDNRMPFSQLDGIPLYLGQLGSGKLIQPFKTVKDYNNWISRATAFSTWADSAIIYFRKGMAEGVVLPKALVEKMIPQMNSFVTTDPTKSVFYGPVMDLPESFSAAEKARLTTAYVKLINEQLVPTYKKLGDFLQTEYLPKARTTSGLSGVPGGPALYDFYIIANTTTNLKAGELFNTGLAEVKRIKGEMEKVKASVGFKGDLKAFMNYINTDAKFFPYKTPEEVLTAYQAIQKKVDPALSKMFLHSPKTPFEVRQIEAYRAESASAQYFAGLTDGSRPGIFYVPILDATKTKFANESLFAHEAIPGHHYQIMLQNENEHLPRFRRYGESNAFIEGWGLYSESLGKELGLYTDPFQKMANLQLEMHRAIRLVVDPGLHSKNWTREQAITYMLDNEPISEQEATAEIERYMAIPGQALGYKVGSMKLQALRAEYTKVLGQNFNLPVFHNEILKDGCMPLDILERKMDVWAAGQKQKK
jgi:uncharacterized protein (DUF885 family)